MRTSRMVVVGALVCALGALGGCPRQQAAAPTTPAPTATPPETTPTGGAALTGLALGEQIFTTGLGANGAHVPFTGGSDRFRQKPGGCSVCHGPDGRGRKLPQGTIPDITYNKLRGGTPPDFKDDAAVIAAIREGKGPQGEKLAAAMPRWQLTDAEASAVIEQLKALDKTTPTSAAPSGSSSEPAAPPSQT